LTPAFWNFQLPKTPPLKSTWDYKKKVGKKKGHENHPKKKKVRALPFVLASWRQKKKSGLSRRKLPRLF
jgi:hypothetical protein